MGRHNASILASVYFRGGAIEGFDLAYMHVIRMRLYCLQVLLIAVVFAVLFKHFDYLQNDAEIEYVVLSRNSKNDGLF